MDQPPTSPNYPMAQNTSHPKGIPTEIQTRRNLNPSNFKTRPKLKGATIKNPLDDLRELLYNTTIIQHLTAPGGRR